MLAKFSKLCKLSSYVFLIAEQQLIQCIHDVFFPREGRGEYIMNYCEDCSSSISSSKTGATMRTRPRRCMDSTVSFIPGRVSPPTNWLKNVFRKPHSPSGPNFVDILNNYN